MDIDGEDKKPTTIPALLSSAPPPPLIPIPQTILDAARNNPTPPIGYASPIPTPVPVHPKNLVTANKAPLSIPQPPVSQAKKP